MLSKSQYIRGLQCHKSLWLLKHRPGLREQPDAATRARFDLGHDVGRHARQLFPGGIEIEFDAADFPGMVERTRRLIESGVEVIYEATFSERGIFAMADILVREADGWSIYEVKASTGVKDYQLDDAAVQWYALSRAIALRRACIVHVDNRYEREGGLDPHRLFRVVDVTGEVEAKQAAIPSTLAGFEATLAAAEPAIDIGPQCSSPFDCDFRGYCWRHVPEQSIFNLYRLSGERKFDFYRRGVIEYRDLDIDNDLDAVQSVQVRSVLENRPILNARIVGDFLDSLNFPLNFLDFETLSEAVPRFEGQRPYSQVPFQYSLHVVDADGSIEHREFLGDGVSDPREMLTGRLLADIASTGSIVAFNAGFEKGRIRELATRFPQHRARLLALCDRFADLLVPFRRLGYYHPDFNGSFSIKAILPAMFPGDETLDYRRQDIQDGGMANSAYASLHLVEDENQREATRQALLAYCRLDTWAMVKIWLRLGELSG